MKFLQILLIQLSNFKIIYLKISLFKKNSNIRIIFFFYFLKMNFNNLYTQELTYQ